MYSGTLRPSPFRPDESRMYHHEKREEYAKRFRNERDGVRAEEILPKKEKPAGDLQQLLNAISPEDSALVSLVLFLLCDNTNNDVVLLGILLYVLLSK